MPPRQKRRPENDGAPPAKKQCPTQGAPGVPDYERDCLMLMNAFQRMDDDDKMVFCLGVIILNTDAYKDATEMASEWFLTWDILEDMMPFLTQPAIDVDIGWTKEDLEEKVQELGLQKQQILNLINPGHLTVIPNDSVVLSEWINSLLNPTRVVMDATLSTVQEVGNNFLFYCSSLKEVDFSPLSNLQNVGDGFLSECSWLKEVDLSPLSNVQEVGDRFLYGCPSLKVVDLSPLCKVQKVRHGFLYGCSLLQELDLSPLCNVQEVGSQFLYGCSRASPGSSYPRPLLRLFVVRCKPMTFPVYHQKAPDSDS